MTKPWIERIEEELTWAEHSDALFWRTCAVGEQHQRHPDVVIYTDVKGTCGNQCRLEGMCPHDSILHELGGDFYLAIRDARRDVARMVLHDIEDRVLALKREKGSGACD